MVVVLSSLAIGLAPTDAAAQNDDSPGQAQFRELTPMSFGQIAAPSIGTNLFTLDWQNNNVTTAGSGDAIHFGGASSGRYRIRAQPYQTVTISAELLDFSADGVVVEEVHLQGPDNTFSTTIDGQGVFIARLGGVVRVDVDATDGTHSADILMSIDYE